MHGIPLEGGVNCRWNTEGKCTNPLVTRTCRLSPQEAILGREVCTGYEPRGIEKSGAEPLRVDTYQHNWGFLVPCKSGFVWEQQTGGCCCHHVHVEGVFIPLALGVTTVDTSSIGVLLELLADANRHYRKEEAVAVWERIKKAMRFDFEILPSDIEEEGIVKIRLTEFKWGSGHGQWVEQFIGKELYLVYPNSD